jgi:hypothetical protein
MEFAAGRGFGADPAGFNERQRSHVRFAETGKQLVEGVKRIDDELYRAGKAA